MKHSAKLLLLGVALTTIIALPITVTAADEDPTTLSGGEIKTMSIQEVSDFYKISADTYAKKLADLLGANIKSSDKIQLLHDNLGLEPSAANDIAKALISSSTVTADTVVTEKIQEKKAEVKNPTKDYLVWQIGMAILALYALTWGLAKNKVIMIMTHKKIWNWVLLVSVIPAIFFGLMLAIKVTYGIGFNLPFSLTYWHVMGGVVMSVISILHISYHARYFVPVRKK